MKKSRRGKSVKPIEAKKSHWEGLPPKLAKELSVVDGIMSEVESGKPPKKSKGAPVKKQPKRFDAQYWDDRTNLDKKMPKDSDSVNFED